MKNLATTVLAFACVVSFMGCPFVVPPVAIPNDDSQCPAACKHLRFLECPEGDPLPDGTTCEKFCSDTQKAGHNLHPECLVNIFTCAAQATCSK